MRWFPLAAVAAVLALLSGPAGACTSFLLSKGATADGSTIISYAADSHIKYGAAFFAPAGNHSASERVEIFNTDTGVYQGSIKQAPYTYNVAGHINEHGLAIGESTFNGLAALSSQDGAIIDYGNLMTLALQRAKTAREAIKVMDALLTEYGYSSTGESFSISDRSEVWYMELIGKGPGEKGAVWVARRVPEGYVSAHANQARITTFPQDKPDECMFSKDLIAFAKRKGFYPKDAPADKFSFADVFHPLTPLSARICEARVWTFFRQVAPSGVMDPYLDFVLGQNLTNRMPLWVPVGAKVTLSQVMQAMRDHYEGTPLDMTQDIGGQANFMPYRWRPLTWTSNGQQYLHERAIGTYQTGYSIIAQSRDWLPAPIGSLCWFGVDDTTTTVWAPLYGGQRAMPRAWAERGPGEGINNFDFDSAFWVFNMVAQLVYPRYSLVYPEVQQRIAALQQQYANEVADIDQQAARLFPSQPQQALALLTKYTTSTLEQLVVDWLKYWKFLFVRFLDGSRRAPNPDPKQPMPKVENPGYPQAFLDRIVAETGDRYKVPQAVASDYPEAEDFQAIRQAEPILDAVKGI